MDRTENLGVNADGQFHPVIIAFHVLCVVGGDLVKPYRVDQVMAGDVVVEVGQGIAGSTVDAVDVVLVFHQVVVHADPEIGGFGLILDEGHHIVVRGSSDSGFQDGEIGVAEVEAQRGFILTVIAHG